MYICICRAVTERQVINAVADGAETLVDLQIDLGVAMCCGRCADTASEYLPGGREAEYLSATEIDAVAEVAANDASVGGMVVHAVARRA
ncbi:MAG TPA: (2Fe-2S)-binding protein [Pusillimonas sp.]|uniref:(2Fe-2S)-binding protein n=1 Tax=Pusillimonas sp. TaxID=3040095 RepID=UPI002C292285|nr:(2Fe-2S)-binding protein [Pusillimonas sp.]HUH88244.1 (2Fe-2S)-binding protein [Pusillimonas sp.]